MFGCEWMVVICEKYIEHLADMPVVEPLHGGRPLVLIVLKGFAELLHATRQSRSCHGGEGRVEEGLIDLRYVLLFLQELQDVVVHEAAGLHGSTRDAVDTGLYLRGELIVEAERLEGHLDGAILDDPPALASRCHIGSARCFWLWRRIVAGLRHVWL